MSNLIERTGRASASSNYEPDLLNGGPYPLYATGNMYNRTRVPPPNSILASPNGSTSSRSTSRFNGPLKLSSYHAILKQIESDQLSNTGVNDNEDLKHFDGWAVSTPLISLFLVEHLRLSRAGDVNQPDPPPASADSGHPNSQCGDMHESPTLFCDNFKLDVSNS